MICVHKLKGEELWINPDQIAFVESGHDSVITFLDGKHLVVRETPEAVAEAVQLFRAQIAALATRLTAPPVPDTATNRPLRSVPTGEA